MGPNNMCQNMQKILIAALAIVAIVTALPATDDVVPEADFIQDPHDGDAPSPACMKCIKGAAINCAKEQAASASCTPFPACAHLGHTCDKFDKCAVLKPASKCGHDLGCALPIIKGIYDKCLPGDAELPAPDTPAGGSNCGDAQMLWNPCDMC